MPSVITTTSGIFASIASITAAFANFGGTKTTEVFAPVAATASLTELKTGSEWPSISTVWPPSWRYTADNFCARSQHSFSVLGSFGASHTLNNDFALRV